MKQIRSILSVTFALMVLLSSSSFMVGLHLCSGEIQNMAQVQVYISDSRRRGISLPVDAVIRDGNGKHVYVETRTNTFQRRKVITGVEDFDRVEITEGLAEGDTVAVTGAYLIYSEMTIRNQ